MCPAEANNKVLLDIKRRYEEYSNSIANLRSSQQKIRVARLEVAKRTYSPFKAEIASSATELIDSVGYMLVILYHDLNILAEGGILGIVRAVDLSNEDDLKNSRETLEAIREFCAGFLLEEVNGIAKQVEECRGSVDDLITI